MSHRHARVASVRIVVPSRNGTLAAALFAAACVLSLPQAASAHDFKVGAIEIEHPWSRATPPGAKVAAGYVEIGNEGSAADTLIGATADIADHAGLHEMAARDGVMTMRPLPGGVPVPAGGDVALKPGSYHIMFMGLKRPLKQGEQFDGTLIFAKAGTVRVTFAVEGIGSMQADHGVGAGQ